MPPDLRDSPFHALRATEFARLDEAGQVYLDYTGSALYPVSLVRADALRLSQVVLGNPHSENPTSALSTARVAGARAAVLEFFHASVEDYEVVFTANASAAAKLVGESFPFTRGSQLVLAADNHNSVNGIRELGKRRGAAVRYLPLDDDLRLAGSPSDALPPARGPSLFAYPAQSNFSGVRHSLALIGAAQALGYRVLVDAAAFVPTAPLSLAEVKPDFVCLSFYKMFGWPTGVGALIARRDALATLRRPWFAGGTVEFASVRHDRHRLLGGAEGFEDGTPNYLGIAAVPQGLAFLSRVGMDRVSARMKALTARLLDALAPLVRLYGPRDTEDRGATVAFNVAGRDGRLVPYWLVERAAARANISVRGGCFCNPGASESAFGIDSAESARCLDAIAPGAFSPQRFSACLDGAPVGAVRVSLGIPTTEADLARFIAFLHRFRKEAPYGTAIPHDHGSHGLGAQRRVATA